MCSIETENIILSYFDKNKDKNEVRLDILRKYVDALQQKFYEQKEKEKESVYINYTRPSLINALMTHLDLLDLENNTIKLLKQKKLDMDFYNSKVPYEIRKEYVNIFDTVDKEIKKQYECATC